MGKSFIKRARGEKRVTNLYKGWCPQQGNKQWLERINAEFISPKQFYNRYVRRRMPVILTASNTDCLDAFSPVKLSKIAGQVRLVVEKGDPDSYQTFGRTDASARLSMRFSEFLSRMKDEELYCSTQPLPENAQGPKALTSAHVQAMIDGGMLPDHLPLMGNLVPYQINAWIGCSEDGTSSGFHHDFHDNFYMLLAGEKQFRLASPNFTTENPTFGCRSNPQVLVHPNGLISYQGNALREDGARRVDVLKWRIAKNPTNVDELIEELEEARLEDMMNRVGRKKPSTSSFPPSFCIEGTAHGEYITETLKAGEMLYLPASFYHEVVSYNSDTTAHHMAINYWYYPPSSAGTFEEPYEDDYWTERWERLAQEFRSKKRLHQARMRRHKIPLTRLHAAKRIRKFIERIAVYKTKTATGIGN
jgi:hypothetical protein